MRGELSDDEGEAGARKRRRTDGRKPHADDLDDDFLDDEEDLLGPGLTREALESLKLPVQENDEDGSGNDDEDEGEEGSDQEDDPSDEGEEDGIPPAMDDLDEETAPELEVEDDEAEGPIAPSSTTKIRPVPNASKKEIPYTFPCPSSIEEFEDILEGLEDSALPTVVQRIRSLHHPSLAQGNKEKLQVRTRQVCYTMSDKEQGFLGVLLDYILIVAGRAIPAFNLISVLTPHIIASVKLNPLTAATHFIAKLSLMQKNLARGHARGASREDSKTFPGCPEIVILRLVGVVWSTSDFSHPVVAPAVLLMCQYLGQSRIRSVSDLASGLFLCSLLAQVRMSRHV